jgi:hypothetical protein
MQINNVEDRSELIKAAIEQLLVPDFFTVRVETKALGYTNEYRIVITDGIASSAASIPDYKITSFGGINELADSIVTTLIHSFSRERFLRK